MNRLYIFIITLFAFYLSNINILSSQTELDYKWVSEGTIERVLIHPNGNILAISGNDVVELDGNTGELIREFYKGVKFWDLSQDGNKISAIGALDSIFIIDYNTKDLLKSYKTKLSFPLFMPDSKTLFLFQNINKDQTQSKLALLNSETDEIIEGDTVNYKIRDIAVSPDGKIVASIAEILLDWYHNIWQARILFWDIETLKPLKEIVNWQNLGVLRIKYSPDSKLLGISFNDKNFYIYNTEKFTLVKHFDPTKNPEHRVRTFEFLDNSLLAYGSVLSSGYNDYYFKIFDLETDAEVFSTKTIGATEIEYNPKNNSVVIIHENLYAYDLADILTSVDDIKTKTELSSEYRDGTLYINIPSFISNSLNCQLFDIRGRIIENININATNELLQIPLVVENGSYFLIIKDGETEYIAKFIVAN
jgi:WD40 repeat protein